MNMNQSMMAAQNQQWPGINQQMANPPFQMPTNNPPGSQVQIPNWNRPPITPQGYSNLSGRTITNPQEIRPNEVLMDGSVSWFPMADGSCVYAKAWGPDGTIQTMRFVPEVPMSDQTVQGPSEFDQVMARLDTIEKMVSQRYNKNNYKNYQKNHADQNTNQEVNNDGV